MNKLFVLDTNVLLTDPEALTRFGCNDICLPISVLEELDKFKTAQGGLGANARAVIRFLDELRERGSLAKGVPLAEHHLGKLQVRSDNMNFTFANLKDTADNYILGIVRRLDNDDPERLVILVTQDINLRLKADALGLTAEAYKHLRVDESPMTGPRTLFVSADLIRRMYEGEPGRTEQVYMPDIPDGKFPRLLQMDITGLSVGEYVALRSTDFTVNALARWDGKAFAIVNGVNESIYGVTPRNAEQRFLTHALMDESIDLVICAGVAGSGKTLLSLACGLEYIQKKRVDRMMITKSILPVGGRDLGFLPGEKDDKLAPWLGPFNDNLEFIMHHRSADVQKMWDEGKVEGEALTYIRGRSLMRRFVIADEMQNVTPSEIKTLVTRLGHSSKLVLLGDPSQIDNPYLDARNNGLVYAMNRMKGAPRVAVLSLVKSERGGLAKLAVERL